MADERTPAAALDESGDPARQKNSGDSASEPSKDKQQLLRKSHEEVSEIKRSRNVSLTGQDSEHLKFVVGGVNPPLGDESIAIAHSDISDTELAE